MKYSHKPALISAIALFIAITSAILVLRAHKRNPFEEASFTKITSSLNEYHFDIDNITDAGTVYQYRKSNLDGTKPRDVYVYIESPLHTESFKIHSGSKDRGLTDLITAEYDTEIFCASRITAYTINPKRELKRISILELRGNHLFITLPGVPWWFFWIPGKYSLRTGHLPVYNYSFDLIDLGFMYRHLYDKQKDFESGIIGFTSGNRFVYAGKALFSFEGKHYYNGYNCNKYKISGEAFGDITGSLYTDTETGITIKIALPLYNSPHLESFLFTLEGSFTAGRDEWREFILSQTESLK